MIALRPAEDELELPLLVDTTVSRSILDLEADMVAADTTDPTCLDPTTRVTRTEVLLQGTVSHPVIEFF